METTREFKIYIESIKEQYYYDCEASKETVKYTDLYSYATARLLFDNNKLLKDVLAKK